MDLTAYEGKINPKDVIMLILGIQNEILGSTRFMKYLFLVCQSRIFNHNDLQINWKPHHYGPYWDDFDTYIASLSNENLLIKQRETSLAGNTTKFSITPKGRQYFNDLSQNYENELPDLTDLIRLHQKESLPSLLKFVYEQYPSFTEKSRIKDTVLDNY